MDKKQQCNKCGEYFEFQLLSVSGEGILYCDECLPEDAPIFHVHVALVYEEVFALLDYIKGSRSLDVLETVDVIEDRLQKQLKRKLKELTDEP